MTSLTQTALAIGLISFSAHAQELPVPPPACSEQFVLDFDSTAQSFMSVAAAIDSKVDESTFHAAVIAALNSCHSYVEQYITIDPVANQWGGVACTRLIGDQVKLIEPRSHQAECEYNQRLLDRAD